MAYSNREKERAFQELYRSANREKRKAYDRQRYLTVTKPARAIEKARALAKAQKGG